MGAVDLRVPSSINIYASSFEDKEEIAALIAEYNELRKKTGNDANVITYSDMVGTMMESVTTIVDMISYVLMAFGQRFADRIQHHDRHHHIHFRIGAYKGNRHPACHRCQQKRYFPCIQRRGFHHWSDFRCAGHRCDTAAESPISVIVEQLTGVADIAKLPMSGGIVLVIISLLLTTIAGLIPSRIASKKDPVEALRSE